MAISLTALLCEKIKKGPIFQNLLVGETIEPIYHCIQRELQTIRLLLMHTCLYLPHLLLLLFYSLIESANDSMVYFLSPLTTQHLDPSYV